MISFRDKNYMYSHNRMKPTAFSTHLHKYYEFLYFVHGDATYVVEGNEYKASDGDLFITCPGELHSIAFRSDRDYERHFIQISEEFLSELGIDMLALLKEKEPGKNNRIPRELLPVAEVDRCFFGVQNQVEKRTEECELLSKTYVIQLLSIVNSLLYAPVETKNTENERVTAAKEFINKNLKSNLSLDVISEATYTDKFYLSHLFKKECGMSITDYISMQRIALAKKLIMDGRSATEVYADCGFNDYSSFYRAFKKLSGKSPSEFFRGKK
ncbi:MAG: AraC family transcriptional regulator [Clostridia bacterium]|nr:AraC family transcriptional regulator [Clostridia bacterium]